MRKDKTMSNEDKSTSNTKTQRPKLGLIGAALSHALNLLAGAGYPSDVSDTSEGVTIKIGGIRSRRGADGRLSFVSADTSEAAQP
jgi:hypothetical protein